jgi:hypothetical protein
MDTEIMAPLLDRADSRLSGKRPAPATLQRQAKQQPERRVGLENLQKIQAQLAAGDNVVLLSNHQTEADPSARQPRRKDAKLGPEAGIVAECSPSTAASRP